MLNRAGLLTDDEYGQVVAAIDELRAAIAAGAFVGTAADEDVHTAVERGLLQILGPLGGKLRAGRSRNDQVATDFRLYLRDAADRLDAVRAPTAASSARPGGGARRHGLTWLHASAACAAGFLRP